MDKFYEWFKNTKLLITTIVALMGLAGTTYKGYTDIKDDIAANTKEFEIFQKQMLSPLVRYAEKNPCTVSDSEWEDYELNYNTLFNLKVKYDNAPINSYNLQKRLEEDKPKCVR